MVKRVNAAMHGPLTTERQKYFHLLSLVCEDLPTHTIDDLVRNGHVASTAQLIAVRQSRKVSLSWLIDMVEVGLPQFRIPHELRPVPVAAPLFQ